MTATSNSDLLKGRAGNSARPMTSSLHYRPYSGYIMPAYLTPDRRNVDNNPVPDASRSLFDNGVTSFPYWPRVRDTPEGRKSAAISDAEHEAALGALRASREYEKNRLTGFGGTLEELVHFPSVAGLTQWLEEEGMPLMPTLKSEYDPNNGKLLCEDNIKRGGDASMNRTTSVEEGYQLLRYGWPEGRERISNAMAEFDRQFRREVERAKWLPNTAGSDVDIAAYVTGDPEHMIDYRPGQDKAKAVTVTVDTNVRCDACGSRPHDAEPTPPDWLLHRGVAAVMLVRQLLRAGYQVTLRTVTHSLYPNLNYPHTAGLSVEKLEERHLLPLNPKFVRENELAAEHWPLSGFMRTVAVDVLTPGRAVDLDNAIFALAHEDYIRRFDFLVHEVMNHKMGWTNHHQNKESSMTKLSAYDRSNSPSVVGELPLSCGFKLAAISVLSEEISASDIYLPSSAVATDIDEWTALERHSQEGNREKAAAWWREYLGSGAAIEAADFSNTETSVLWTIKALEGLGVRFV